MKEKRKYEIVIELVEDEVMKKKEKERKIGIELKKIII